MKNSFKIQTMKGDLEELSKGPVKPVETENQEKTLKESSFNNKDGINTKEKKPNLDLEKRLGKSKVAEVKKEDEEVKKLKNLISKFSAAKKDYKPKEESSEKEKTLSVESVSAEKEKGVSEKMISEVNKSKLRETISSAESLSEKSGFAKKVETASAYQKNPSQDKVSKKEIQEEFPSDKKNVVSNFWKNIAKKIKEEEKEGAKTKTVAKKEKKSKSEKNEIDSLEKKNLKQDRKEISKKEKRGKKKEDVTEDIKKEKEKIYTEQEKTKNDTEKEEEIINKKTDKSGILKIFSKKDKKPKENEKPKDIYYKGEQYIPPTERLILGKQEYYSSIRKKIKERKEEERLERLKKVSIEKKKIISKGEEYKKLKKEIIKKYRIKIFPIPWKRVFIVTIVGSFAIVVAFYFVSVPFIPPEPPLPPPPVVGEEIDRFANIKSEIKITENKIKLPGSLERTLIMSKDEAEIKKIIIIKENGNIIGLEEALKAIWVNTDNLPDGFLDVTTNEYNIFIFKTKNRTFRKGLAVKTSDAVLLGTIFESWETESNRNNQMSEVFKPLFSDDRVITGQNSIFRSNTYKRVNIRYLHLPNEDTALNYFIHDDILVITTSKDSIFKMIDVF